jgi:hypothetical protein
MLSDEQACRGCSSRSTPDSAVEGGVLTEEQAFHREDNVFLPLRRRQLSVPCMTGKQIELDYKGKRNF